MSYLTFNYLTYSYLSDTDQEFGNQAFFLRSNSIGSESLFLRGSDLGVESQWYRGYEVGTEALLFQSFDLGTESEFFISENLGSESLFLRSERLGNESLLLRSVLMGSESLFLRHEPVGTEALLFQSVDLGSESLFLRANEIGTESLLKIYNTDNLRVLCDFQSRGLVDNNWSVFQGGVAAGDFGVNNLNTDIPEEVYRSQNAFVILDCDVGRPQGVSPDTFVIWNHNLTSGAVVTMEASNDPGFGSTLYDIRIPWTKDNMFFITPVDDFPYQLARYYRIQITDTDNPDGYVQIGNILFGNAIIMQGECITDNVQLRYTEFKDEIPTEGFTSVVNPRTLKKGVTMEIRNISYGRGNYRNLIDNVFLSARTSLRCVWIPYMYDPSRFAVFGRLTELPQEEHNVKGDLNEDLDFVSFTIDVDEAL